MRKKTLIPCLMGMWALNSYSSNHIFHSTHFERIHIFSSLIVCNPAVKLHLKLFLNKIIWPISNIGICFHFMLFWVEKYCKTKYTIFMYTIKWNTYFQVEMMRVHVAKLLNNCQMHFFSAPSRQGFLFMFTWNWGIHVLFPSKHIIIPFCSDAKILTCFSYHDKIWALTYSLIMLFFIIMSSVLSKVCHFFSIPFFSLSQKWSRTRW